MLLLEPNAALCSMRSSSKADVPHSSVRSFLDLVSSMQVCLQSFTHVRSLQIPRCNTSECQKGCRDWPVGTESGDGALQATRSVHA